MAKGWIKLHRQLIDHWAFEDPVILKTWIYLLLKVNHEDKKILLGGDLVTVKTGQTITSIRQLAAIIGCSRRKMSNILKMFEKDGMITTQTIKNGTALALINYGRFQNARATDVATDDTTNVATLDTTDVATGVATDVAQTRNIRTINNDIRMNKENKKTASRIGFYDTDLED